MTDAEWAAVRPSLRVPAWFQGRGGRPVGYCRRQWLDAIRYLVAGGISWRAMPADFPDGGRVYAFFFHYKQRRLPTGRQSRPQGGGETDGVLGEPESVAHDWSAVFIDEREQVRLAAADLRSAEGVSGQQLVPGGLEPAEYAPLVAGAGQPGVGEVPLQSSVGRRPALRGPQDPLDLRGRAGRVLLLQRGRQVEMWWWRDPRLLVGDCGRSRRSAGVTNWSSP
ncbi:transposase [Streptomyces sp. NPDC088762]|uniref:transposase n=1 Tax=Streptomyces sp. NPDC088762 TaxID=3365891 RepID=UPI00381704DD